MSLTRAGPSQALRTRRLTVSLRRLLNAQAGQTNRAFRFHLAASFMGKPDWMSAPSVRSRRPASAAQAHPADSPIGRFRDQQLAVGNSDERKSAGEDFFYMTTMRNHSGVSFGVADGVGGWVESGYDPSLFSQSLMYHAAQYAGKGWAGEPETDPTLDQTETQRIEGWQVTPLQCLDHAYLATLREPRVIAGSSTATLVSLNASSGFMRAVNLGDSGFCIVRSSAIVHWQPPQTHFFNCPRQLAKLPGNTRRDSGRIDDRPSAGDLFQTPLRDGDIVIAFTDGLSDNVFPGEITRMVQLATRTGSEDAQVQSITDRLVEFAQDCMFKENKPSPFQVEAARQKPALHHRGGKIDDVTVLACMVRETT